MTPQDFHFKIILEVYDEVYRSSFTLSLNGDDGQNPYPLITL